jgi:hypothetical protein
MAPEMTNAGEISRISTSKLMETEIPAHLQRLAGYLGTLSLGTKPSRKNFSNFDDRTDENGYVLA